MADPEIGAVAINWAVYGSSGHHNAGEGLVIERFTRRAPQDFHINRHVKTFIRPDRCAGVSNNPHSVRLNAGRYIDSAGQDVAWDQTVVPSGISTKVVWRNIRVDHFVTKSLEEFERKRARGSAHSPSTEDERRHEDYFRYHDRNDVEDPMPEPLVRRTKIELERLRAKLAGLDRTRPDGIRTLRPLRQPKRNAGWPAKVVQRRLLSFHPLRGRPQLHGWHSGTTSGINVRRSSAIR